ncbi:MAG: hypothetical protein R2715_04075 [Ilumatobacteraceae bacterium]
MELRSSGGGRRVVMDNGTTPSTWCAISSARSRSSIASTCVTSRGTASRTPPSSILETERDVVATIDLSWNEPAEQPWFLRAVGSEGEVRVGWGGTVLTTGGAQREIEEPYDKLIAMGGPVDAAEIVRTGTTARPLCTAADAVRTSEVVEAIYLAPVWASASARRVSQDPSQAPRIHPTAIVEDGVVLGAGTSVWHHAHVRGPQTTIGESCIIGGSSYVAYGVTIGTAASSTATSTSATASRSGPASCSPPG